MDAIGADILHAAALIAIFVGSAFAGVQVNKKTGKALLGWLAAITLLVASVYVFGPSLKKLRGLACSDSADYSNCINPGEQEYL